MKPIITTKPLDSEVLVDGKPVPTLDLKGADMTNAEVFKAVFGFTPPDDRCPMDVDCLDCRLDGVHNCTQLFWNSPYRKEQGTPR